mgnify:CR=1 FL=1
MIRTENLNFVYQSDMPFSTAALHNVNIEIKDGSFTALIGHTGSGKSTLIQTFNALIKPTSGRIYVDDYDVCAENADLKEIRKKVGLVFQYPEHQLFEETVEKDIAFGPKNMGFSEEEIMQKVKKAAKDVGLADELLKKSPFELSGGQRRRAAIAGVLATEPKILILDEPMAGLDPHGRDELIKLLKDIHRKDEEKTIIFVSHSMEDVAKLAENVIVLNKGEVFASGSVREVFSKGTELMKIGLNVPEITRLIIKLREKGIDLPTDIYTVEAAEAIIKEKISGGKNA